MGAINFEGFDPLSNNQGKLVDENYFNKQHLTKRDIANSILEKIGGAKKYGFNLSNVVEAMVNGEVGDKILTLKTDIINTNVRISALAKLKNFINEFKRTTLTPLETQYNTTGVTSSDPNGIRVSLKKQDSLEGFQPFDISVAKLAKPKTWSSSKNINDIKKPLSGDGELTITELDKKTNLSKAEEIQIKSGSSLLSIVEQINNANKGIRASIAERKDGFHLAIYDKNMGTAQGKTISFSGNQQIEGVFHDILVVQHGENAEFTIDGVSMIAHSNNIRYQNISIHLNKANTTAYIDKETNTDKARAVVLGFVKNYNDFMTFIKSLESSMPGLHGTGAFNNDDDIKKFRDQIVSSVEGYLNSDVLLSDIGIEMTHNNMLSLNQSRLETALDADPDIVKKLFVTIVSSTSSNIFVVDYAKIASNFNSKTESGKYKVEVTQLPKKAEHQLKNVIQNVKGNVVLNQEVVLKLKVSGNQDIKSFNSTSKETELNVHLKPGSYSFVRLVDLIQKQINAKEELIKNRSLIDVSLNQNRLKFSMKNAGSDFGFSFIKKGSKNTSILGIEHEDFDPVDAKGNALKSYQGKDIEGKINGSVALGSGNYLKLLSDSKAPNRASGLIVKVTASQIGEIGSVCLSRGCAETLDNVIQNFNQSSDINPEKRGLLAYKEYKYLESVDSKNENSLINQLKGAYKRKNQLAQQYFEQYKYVNDMLAKEDMNEIYIKSIMRGGQSSDEE